MHTRPDRSGARWFEARGGGSTLAHVTTRSRVRCYTPLVIGAICLGVAGSVSPIVAYALTISAFVLFFEGGLALYERAGGRTGGMKDFHQ